MIVRARHERATTLGTPLLEMPETFRLLGVARVHMTRRGHGDKGRIAEVTITEGRVDIVEDAKLKR